MGRTVRRVPLDFDAPLDEVWAPLLHPERFRFPACEPCEGTGYSPQARQLENTAWRHRIAYNGTPEQNAHRDSLFWLDKLTQADVDYLIAQNHLRVLVKREPTEDNDRPWEWVSKAWSADEVNAVTRIGKPSLSDPLDLGSMEIHALIRRRCEAIGASHTCSFCDGHGSIASAELRKASDDWEPPEIPKGPGWQLWSTTTEGTPKTPVFRSAQDLAAYCAGNGVSWFGHDTATYEEWLTSFLSDSTEIDTMLVMAMPPPPTREQAGVPPEAT